MATNDTCCTIVPYWKIQPGKLEDFKAGCEKFVERTRTEEKCLYYGFSFNGDEAFTREGYEDAEGVLAHLENVGDLIEEALKISSLARLEVHGPAQELEKLRDPLKALNPTYFTLEYGFRR